MDRFGDGEFVACFRQISVRCPIVLDFEAITVDRVLSRCNGGHYLRGNILPVCGPCNSTAGNLDHRGRAYAGPTFEQMRVWALEPLSDEERCRYVRLAQDYLLRATIQTTVASGSPK